MLFCREKCIVLIVAIPFELKKKIVYGTASGLKKKPYTQESSDDSEGVSGFVGIPHGLFIVRTANLAEQTFRN